MQMITFVPLHNKNWLRALSGPFTTNSIICTVCGTLIILPILRSKFSDCSNICWVSSHKIVHELLMSVMYDNWSFRSLWARCSTRQYQLSCLRRQTWLHTILHEVCVAPVTWKVILPTFIFTVIQCKLLKSSVHQWLQVIDSLLIC